MLGDGVAWLVLGGLLILADTKMSLRFLRRLYVILGLSVLGSADEGIVFQCSCMRLCKWGYVLVHVVMKLMR